MIHYIFSCGRDACVRFMELWKKKHENGQWVEIEAAEAMANQLDIAAMNASGILLSNIANKQFDSNSEMASENYVKSSTDGNSGNEAILLKGGTLIITCSSYRILGEAIFYCLWKVLLAYPDLMIHSTLSCMKNYWQGMVQITLCQNMCSEEL